jgi:DNA repair protein RadC
VKTIQKVSLRVQRVSLVAEGSAEYSRLVAHARDAANVARSLIATESQEVFLTFHLDVKNRVIGYTEGARGSTTACTVDPTSAFRAAIVNGAHAVIFAHNHPSGDPSPSADDISVTERFFKCGELLGIKVLDHVIVTEHSHFSFLDAGLIPGMGGK